jgi:hemolysin III
MGWVGVAAAPAVIASAGWTPAVLLLAGGLVYSVGAYVYAVRRPDPIPAVFGYHEVFHTLVVVAALTHYVAVAMTLLR